MAVRSSGGAQRSAKERAATARLKAQVDRERQKVPKPKAKARTKLEAQVATQRGKILAGTSTLKADTGDIAKGSKVAKRQPKGYKPPAPKVQTAGVSVDHLGGVIDAAKGIARVAGRAGKDVIDLPVNVVKGTYENVAADVELLQGRPQRARKLYEAFRDHDPLALAAQGKFKQAGHEISAHPGNFAVEVAGAKGSVGRGVTKVQRKAGVKIPTREPARVPNSPIAKPRPYSEDAITRSVQVRREKRAVTKADTNRVKADELEKMDRVGRADEIAALREEANRKDPRRLGASEAKKRAARTATVHQGVSEANQAAVAKRVRDATTVDGHKPTAAVVLKAQNIADGTPASIASYRARVVKTLENPHLPDDERVAARATLKELDKAAAAKAKPAEVAKAADEYRKIMDPLQAKLHGAGIVDAKQTRKASLVPYAVTHMEDVVPGAKGPKRTGPGAVRAKVRSDGTPVARTKADGTVVAATTKRVSEADIRKHMGDMPEPAFVSQRPAGARPMGGGRGLTKPKVAAGPRTGKATALGLADVSPDILPKSAAAAQRLVDVHDSYQAKLKEAAYVMPGSDAKGATGKRLSRAKALKRAKELHARDGIEYTVIPHDPFRGNRELASTLNREANDPAATQAMVDALKDAYDGKSDVPGDYAIVPKAYADELSAQASRMVPDTTVGAVLKSTSGVFRRTVLATSPTWLTGNVLEGGLRSLVYGVKPGDAKLYSQRLAYLEKVDPYAAQMLRARVEGGGHYQSADSAMRERGQLLSHFDESNPAVRRGADALSAFWAKPGPATAAKMWDAYTHFVFNQMNGRFESRIRKGMAGRAMRKMELIDPQMVNLSRKATDEAARGLTDTNTQAALGEELAKAYGRYDGFTSGTKYAIQTYTPFLAWSLNSARFVLHTLPKDHPTVTLLAAAMQNATRDAKDLDIPDWLKGSIPVGGGNLRLLRYTPFGFFSDPGQSAAGLVLPQFSGALQMLAFGQDWKGKKIRDENGDPIKQGERAQRAFLSFLGGTVPVVQRAARAAEDPSSLNPFKVIAPKPHGTTTPKAKAVSGSGIDWSTYGGGASASGIDWSTYGTP